jgi:hypothetical protein
MRSTIAHQHRLYRDRISARDLVSFTVAVQETDLFMLADKPLPDQARASILNYRHQLEEYIRAHPPFLESFSPLPPDPLAPPIIREMLRAADAAGVGPMAAVAGAFAETVGRDLLQFSGEIVVENGGDLYLKVARDITIGIYAGDSPLSNRLALRIPANATPAGVCTSSGTVGHSISLGRADAVTIIAASAFLADAAATAVGNCVSSPDDIQRGLERAQAINGVRGAVIIINDQMGAWGAVELVSVSHEHGF